MRVPPARIVFSAEDRKLILARIDESLASGQLTLGKNGKEFEERFARAHGVPHAVAVNSGTSSIEIPLRVLGAEGGEVLVPTNTFMATVFGVAHAGASVRFVDHDPLTLAPSPAQIEAAITPKTRGVIVVHIGGAISPAMPEIAALCRERGLFLFEDAAHAHGATLDSRHAGTFGDAGSFSFYPTKLMTSGEGGMIVTGSARLAEESRLYRDQGKASFTANVHDRLGYNWRMSEPHAAIGLVHLERLPGFIEERRALAAIYDEGLRSIPGVAAWPVPARSRSNYYKYVALLEPGLDRAAIKTELREKHGVGLSGEVYERPCHLQPLFEGRYEAGSFPEAERFCARHVCLPLFNTMKEEDARFVLESLGRVVEARRRQPGPVR